MHNHTEYINCFGRFKLENNSTELVSKLSEEDALEASKAEYSAPKSGSLNRAQQEQFLKEMRKPQYKEDIRLANILIVKKLIAESVSEDTYIIQAINSIEDLNRICNTLVKRVREWYAYYFPELEKLIEDNEVFVKRILQKSKQQFMQDYSITISMGPQLAEKDVDMIINFAREVNDLYIQRDNIIKYLEDVMKTYCPNVYHLTGALIGAKLLEKAGSLRHLAMLPSSTVQLLGAEKALFRHLRNRKARPPKHGYILSHPLLMEARREDKGNVARAFASKISIAAKVDYFHGDFIADNLKEELEAQTDAIKNKSAGQKKAE